MEIQFLWKPRSLNRDVLRPHYIHVPYYTSAASTGWAHWAKAILVNSLLFMRRVIPHLFQLSFGRACRNAARNPSSQLLTLSLLRRNFPLDCFSSPLIWPSHLFFFYMQPNWQISFKHFFFTSNKYQLCFFFLSIKRTIVSVTICIFPSGESNFKEKVFGLLMQIEM